MSIFNKNNLSNLANKAIENSKKVATAVSNKASELKEKQDNKNKHIYSPIQVDSSTKMYKILVVGEYYFTSNIEKLGLLDERFSWNKQKAIKENLYGWVLTEYTFLNEYEVNLEFEPTNQHDPKAIKVILNGIQVGYIPKEQTDSIRTLIKRGIKGINTCINGSKKKVLLRDQNNPKGYFDYTEHNYSIELYIVE